MSTKILAAVSGGADSMCMLDLLLRQGNEVVAAHFNHKMRGAESDDDEAFVRHYCNSRGIELICGSSSQELRSEQAARDARYAFLHEAAGKTGCEFIATAHNKNDNAETVLLNLTRGTGLKGLCGIPARRGNLIRPLLSMTRQEILRYNETHDIPFRNDSSNESDVYARNRIRHQVIPVLESINPDAVEAISRMTELLIQDEEYLSSRPYEEHPAIASRYIRTHCPKPLSRAQVEAVMNLGSGYKQLDLPGIHLVKDGGKLFFEPTPAEFSVEIREGIVYNEFTNDCIRCDSIKGPLRITTRQPGDRMRVAGRHCTKTLKQLFLEAGLTQEERNSWPVARDDEGVLWVYRLGQAERSVPSPGDRGYYLEVTENNHHAPRCGRDSLPERTD